MSIFIFTEADGSFSWRKALTGITACVFATACVGFLVTHKFDELPGSYQAIIAGVFVFYFGKKILEGVKITNK